MISLFAQERGMPMTSKEQFYINLEMLPKKIQMEKENLEKVIQTLHSQKLAIYTKMLRLIDNELLEQDNKESLSEEELSRRIDLMNRQEELLEEVSDIDFEINYQYQKHSFMNQRNYLLYLQFLLMIQRKFPEQNFGFKKGIVSIIPQSQLELGGNTDIFMSMDAINWQKNLTETYHNEIESQRLLRKMATDKKVIDI